MLFAPMKPVTTRFLASCSTHAVPPLFRFPSLFSLSLTRLPHVDLVSLIPDSCMPHGGLAPLMYITVSRFRRTSSKLVLLWNQTRLVSPQCVRELHDSKDSQGHL